MRKTFCVLVVLAALLMACGQPTSDFGAAASTAHDHSASAASKQPAGALTPVVATSEIVVGPNRLALGLLENNVPIKDAAATKVNVRYFTLGDPPTQIGQEAAQFYGEGLGERGTFIVHPTFEAAGDYGLEIEAQRQGKPPEINRISIKVAATGSAPNLGQDAPRSKTPTASQVSDLTLLSSAATPDPRLHQMSVDQAVTSGKPSLILFATPGYCQTAVCGPGVDVLQQLSDRFGTQLHAVHVEVYRLPYRNAEFVPAMREWGLQTEPWLFLVDKAGKIAGRYEGGITFAELEPAVAKLVQP